MPVKKNKNMSLAMNPEMQNLLKVSAKKLDCSVSELVRMLVDRYLDKVLNEDDNITIVLTMPGDMRGKPQAVQEWLNKRVPGIVHTVGNSDADTK